MVSLREIIKNIKGWFSKDKKEDTWHDESDKIADKLQQINDNLKKTQEIMASAKPDDTKIAEWGGKLDQYTKPADAALKTYKTAIGSIDILDTIIKNIKKFNSIDLAKNPQDGAKKFDEIFSDIGKLGGKLPDGPWQIYFEFMEGFKGGFFNFILEAQKITDKRIERESDGIIKF
jgi:small-conductance mechanosensitive channel